MVQIFTDDFDGDPSYTWSTETGVLPVAKFRGITPAPLRLNGHIVPEYVWQQAKAGDRLSNSEGDPVSWFINGVEIPAYGFAFFRWTALRAMEEKSFYDLWATTHAEHSAGDG